MVTCQMSPDSLFCCLIVLSAHLSNNSFLYISIFYIPSVQPGSIRSLIINSMYSIPVVVNLFEVLHPNMHIGVRFNRNSRNLILNCVLAGIQSLGLFLLVTCKPKKKIILIQLLVGVGGSLDRNTRNKQNYFTVAKIVNGY